MRNRLEFVGWENTTPKSVVFPLIFILETGMIELIELLSGFKPTRQK